MCDVMLAKIRFGFQAQSRQSTRIFLQSSEQGPPPPTLPHPQASVSPPPFGSAGGGLIACGRGVGFGGSNSYEGETL
jgi:hypothetical protein